MPGTLYIVATPIGNLEDFSPRAARVLREVTLIAAEDTRTTRKLLARFDIHTPLTSYHAHSGDRKVEAILERLAAGEDVALVSDAGTPGISDPGGILVRAALQSDAAVSPIPGPSAVVTALSASGLDPSRFLFEGFLPRGGGDRRRTLAALRGLPHTLVFYEAPGRVAETLDDLRAAFGNRPACVAREVTKRFEEFLRGGLEELAARLRENLPRGECVLLVGGAVPGEEIPAEPGSDESPEARIEARLTALMQEGKSVRDAARQVAEEFGRSRREVYSRAMQIAERH